MRLKILFLYFFISFFALSSYGQNNQDFKVLANFPDYETIVEHFLKYHDLSDSKKESFHQYRFERKPEGWLAFSEFNKPSGLNSDKGYEIWNSKSGYKINPDTGPAEIRLPEQFALALTNNNRYDFIIHPFYGYIGWDEDVIRYFSKIKTEQMSEHELYGLSRAHSHRASNIFWNHSIYSDPKLVRSSNARRSDLRKYMKLSYKSISHLKDLYLRNPDYQCLIGLSDIKLANQIMAHWYELVLFGHQKEADNFIRETKPNYHDFWANSSKFLLENIEEDAIIICNGDNDTYPHLWNQAYNKIRPDISIINLSLLNDAKYFSLLIDENQPVGKIISGFSQEEIINLGKKNFHVLNDTARMQLSFAENENNLRSLSASSNTDILLEYGYYSMSFLNKNLEHDTLVMLNASRRQISLPQIFLSNIIFNQIDTRPIYFIKNINPEIIQMLNPASLLDEGLVIRLTNEAPDYPEFNFSYYDTSKVNTLLNALPVKLPNKKHFAREQLFQLFLEMESRAISDDLNGLNAESKYKEILDYLDKYPPQITGLSLHYFNMIYTLFQTGFRKDLAQMFLKAFIVELENEIRDTELTDSDPNDYLNLRYLTYIIDSVIRSELDPKIPNFHENLFILEKSINKKLRQIPEVKLN